MPNDTPDTPASTPVPPARANTKARKLPNVPEDVLSRFNAKVLDPSVAVRVPGQPPFRSTVYVTDQLIFSGRGDAAARQALEQAATQLDLKLEWDDAEDKQPPASHRHARAVGLDDRPELFSVRVRIAPAGTGPASPPDAWHLLQTYRTIVGREGGDTLAALGLDHLVTATAGPDIGGNPFFIPHGVEGNPFFIPHGGPGGAGVGGNPFFIPHGIGSAQYASPGYGGRAPVNWVGRPPHRRDDGDLPGKRRPVAVVLDTGIGRHPWLGPSIVKHDLFVNGEPLGLQDITSNPEGTGVVDDPYEGVLDPDAGHGTFIAGLIRQACPDADLIGVRVMSSDGVVVESDLLEALKLLVVRQHDAQVNNKPDQIIDLVSLSMGYYHEQPEDITFDPTLLQPLQALGDMGVAVVVSAGNDSTSRPLYPAAFAPYPLGRVTAFSNQCIPVVCVGAQNPNRTVALFSNVGAWIKAHRPGVALVSTFPITFDGGGQPPYRVKVPGEPVREAFDSDNYHSGFGTWSGTSFSAPILGGELLEAMVDGRCGSLDDIGAPESVARMWAAIAKVVGVNRP